MNSIIIPESYNYIAVFLTLKCNLKCSYCINSVGDNNPRRRNETRLTGEQWAKTLNRIQSRSDLPITFQGGEPTLHPDFYSIVRNIKSELNIDLLTNGQYNALDFAKKIPSNRLKRKSPYASIRISFHPEQMELLPTIHKALFLQNMGYSVGVWMVEHPAVTKEIIIYKKCFQTYGIDFRTKSFLGKYGGELYGVYKYDAYNPANQGKAVQCKTTELIIGPDGKVYRCTADLYDGQKEVGNITDPSFVVEDVYRPCNRFGCCNPCDIKIKNNRFQEYGHTSVDIKSEDKR